VDAAGLLNAGIPATCHDFGFFDVRVLLCSSRYEVQAYFAGTQAASQKGPLMFVSFLQVD
jgi:hypothetical protein